MDILDQIRLDYQRFPHDQSYHLYVDDLYFEDPLNKFRGVDRYRRMIDFISQWFKDIDLQLHDIQYASPTQINTRLKYSTPRLTLKIDRGLRLPWCCLGYRLLV